MRICVDYIVIEPWQDVGHVLSVCRPALLTKRIILRQRAQFTDPFRGTDVSDQTTKLAVSIVQTGTVRPTAEKFLGGSESTRSVGKPRAAEIFRVTLSQ